MRVALSARAAKDFEEIGDWIARDSPLRAESFVNELLDRGFSLARNPRRFPEVAAGRGLRKMSWRGYVILCRIGPDGVEIARIAQGSRDWGSLLRELE